VIRITRSRPLAEPVHRSYASGSLWHVVPPVVELPVSPALQLVLLARLVGTQPLDASLLARGCLGPPCADRGDDCSDRRYGTSDSTRPGQRIAHSGSASVLPGSLSRMVIACHSQAFRPHHLTRK
jgi:hypothetical protein